MAPVECSKSEIRNFRKSPKFQVDFRCNLTLFLAIFVRQIFDILADAWMFPFEIAIPNSWDSHVRSIQLYSLCFTP